MSVRKVQRFTEQDIQRVVARGVRSPEAGIAAAWAAQGVPTASSRSGQAQGAGSRVDPAARGAKAMKPKTCKACGKKFTPLRRLQVACSIPCVITHVQAEKARKEARAHREAKAKAKTRQQWMKEAQAAVNSYVRARDANLGCVSCDKPASWDGQWHASHFRSTGAASSVRFNLWNIHKSCSVCNNFKSGNLGEYTPMIRAKIGDEKVDWLYAQNTPVTYSVEYLQRLKKVFNKKTKRLLARNGWKATTNLSTTPSKT